MYYVRPAVELIELPYTFTQLPVLMPRQFISEARERGVHLSDAHLEALHRARLLTPLLRVRRDVRLVAQLAPRDAIHADQVAHWEPTNRRDLVDAYNSGLVTDPASERFISRRSRERNLAELEFLVSDYLYSSHQLLMLPTIKAVLPHLRARKSGAELVLDLDVNAGWLDAAKMRASELRDIVIAVSALEPVHYPKVIRKLTLPFTEDSARYDRWKRDLPLLAIRKWLDVDADWIKQAARWLLDTADGFDPLGDWLDVVRAGEPSQWKRLKRDARSAMDYRIGAEVLLRYYDALVRGRRAKPLPDREGRWRGQFDSRLKPSGNLDRILTEYGLSPHPSLVLVLEGRTEFTLFPRVMQMFEVRTDRDFIAIEDMAGVGRDLTSLVSFAVFPHTEPDEYGRYLEPLRPLTQILVVTDAEGPMRTQADRNKKRRAWVDRLVKTLPREHRTEAVKESLDRLVYVDTWNRGGRSFEFAHFTDRQLAHAIARVSATGQPTLTALTNRVASVRASRGNLDSLLNDGSKVSLANELWPVLERRIRRAERNKTEGRIPIVRVLDRAIRIAHELPRGKVVIPLQPRPGAS
jgi:hypothetical protein